MSGRIVREVLDCAPRDLKLAEMLVYIVLAEEARDRTRTVCLPAEVISHRSRVRLGTVYNALSELVGRGLLRRGEKAAHKGMTQRYTLTKLEPFHREVEKPKPHSPVKSSLTPGLGIESLRLVDNPSPGQPKPHPPVTKPHSGVMPLRKYPVRDTTASSLETNDVSSRLQ